jgi:hypothetical protein
VDSTEISSRVESMVGNLLGHDGRIDWGDRIGTGWVEASRKNEETVHIDLDLELTSITTPAVDMDFDLSFRFTRVAGDWRLDISASNLETHVDYNWLVETLSFVLPCGPVVSIIEGVGVPDCIDALERYIASRVQRAWVPIARHFVVGQPCPAGFRPQAVVTERTDVLFACAADGPG